MNFAAHAKAQVALNPPRQGRVLLYSHDTFGLGHLRRSKVLAAAICQAQPETSAIILTGSPVAGRFAFPDRVDHIRLPGVTKTSDGSYLSETLGLDIDDTTEMRAALIKATAETFAPDILIVDKEPAGFRAELVPTLEMLRQRGHTRIVLGLRDVLDSPDVLAAEWERKGALDITEHYYDEIWVYGPENFYDPTHGLSMSDALRARMVYTGFLRRDVTDDIADIDAPFVLVTPGGGGDGEAMVDLVLSAYEKAPDLDPMAVLVYGPFLSGDVRDRFEARVAALGGRVRAVGFDSQIETLMAAAQGVICMGGYNTFCELLSFDKRAVIVPRTVPRREQHIRASRAKALGLAQMLDEDAGELTPAAMIRAIRALPDQSLPSQAMTTDLLGGLEHVINRAGALLSPDTVSES